MALEIERKFLPASEGWRPLADAGVRCTQGYLMAERGRTVRVRLLEDADGETGYLTIKGPAGASGLARAEYEYPIPPAEARELLALCLPTPIEKTRYRIPLDGLVWEVDEFHGANAGLVVIEVELASEGQEIALPDWVGPEVSRDARYKNAVLSRRPFREWAGAGERPVPAAAAADDAGMLLGAPPPERQKSRRRVEDLFPGLSGQKGLSSVTVFGPGGRGEVGDLPDVPRIDEYYVFRDTSETRRLLYAVEHPDTPCYLVGPTGCGKTSLIEQVCARTGRPVTRINLDRDLGRSDFLGLWVLKGDKTMAFHHGPVPAAIHKGHVLILDELDVASPGVILLFQACLEGRDFTVLETEEVFRPHPDFRIMATANTTGLEGKSVLYQGAGRQNFALLDRFRWFLAVPYPTQEEETRMLAARYGDKLGRDVYKKLAQTAQDIRNAHESGEIAATMSTRVLINVARDMLDFGCGHNEAFRNCFLNRLAGEDRDVCQETIASVWGR